MSNYFTKGSIKAGNMLTNFFFSQAWTHPNHRTIADLFAWTDLVPDDASSGVAVHQAGEGRDGAFHPALCTGDRDAARTVLPEEEGDQSKNWGKKSNKVNMSLMVFKGVRMMTYSWRPMWYGLMRIQLHSRPFRVNKIKLTFYVNTVSYSLRDIAILFII